MRDGCANAAEIGAIKQVSVAIFAKRDHQRRRCRAQDVDNDWIRAAQVDVAAVEGLPICRRPMIRGRSTENRPWLEADNGLAAAPGSGSAGGIAGRDEKVRPVTRDPTGCPDSRLERSGGPRAELRTVQRNAKHASAIIAYIRISTVGDINHIPEEGERAALHVERRAEVWETGVHVDRETGIDRTGINVQGVNHIVRTADHGDQKERTRGQIDYRCASNADWRDKSHARRRRAHVTLPDNRSRDRIERVDIIGFRYRDDFGTAVRPAFDVERLGIDVAHNRAVKVHIPRQIRRRRRSKGRVNEQSIAREIVMMLSDVDGGASGSRRVLRKERCRGGNAQNSQPYCNRRSIQILHGPGPFSENLRRTLEGHVEREPDTRSAGREGKMERHLRWGGRSRILVVSSANGQMIFHDHVPPIAGHEWESTRYLLPGLPSLP